MTGAQAEITERRAKTSLRTMRVLGSLVVEKGQRLQAGDLERLAAAHVRAGQFIVAAHHVGLRFGKFGAIAFVGIAGQLRAFAADYPGDLVIVGLPALGTGEAV